jgi:branched-chain amino acid transport system substrate-binding protein
MRPSVCRIVFLPAAWLVVSSLLLFAPAAAKTCRAADPADGLRQNYGHTPEEYLPYSRFAVPYKKLFVDPTEYRGYGRRIPEPASTASVKIGFLGPIKDTVSVATGGASHETALGIRMLQGARLAIEHANAGGGYRGTGAPYELVVRNDNGLWGASGEEVIRLAYKDRVWAILGTIDGANSHIAIRAALKLELPVMTCGDTDPTFTETAIPWAFRCIVDDRQMCYLLADYVFGRLGLTRIAALRANDRYARTGIANFRDAAVRIGHPLIEELNYEVGDVDFTAQLKRLKELDPEAIITYGNVTESALIVKQMRAMGMDQWLIGSDRLVSPRFFEIAGRNVDRVAAGYPYKPDNDSRKYSAFRRDFVARYGEEPEAYAAFAYDGMNMIIAAIEKAGLNRARIRDALAAMKMYQGVTGRMEFDATFNNIGPASLAVVEDGRFRIYSHDEALR